MVQRQFHEPGEGDRAGAAISDWMSWVSTVTRGFSGLPGEWQTFWTGCFYLDTL